MQMKVYRNILWLFQLKLTDFVSFVIFVFLWSKKGNYSASRSLKATARSPCGRACSRTRQKSEFPRAVARLTAIAVSLP